MSLQRERERESNSSGQRFGAERERGDRAASLRFPCLISKITIPITTTILVSLYGHACVSTTLYFNMYKYSKIWKQCPILSHRDSKGCLDVLRRDTWTRPDGTSSDKCLSIPLGFQLGSDTSVNASKDLLGVRQGYSRVSGRTLKGSVTARSDAGWVQTEKFGPIPPAVQNILCSFITHCYSTLYFNCWFNTGKFVLQMHLSRWHINSSWR